MTSALIMLEILMLLAVSKVFFNLINLNLINDEY